MKPPNNTPPQGFKMTELGILPEEWEVVRLGEIFNVQQGKQLSEKESKEGKIKKSFLRTSNLNWGHIDISSIDEMYYTLEEFEKLRLKNGDILVCEGGDVGRTALYRGELVECAYQNHLHRLRPKKDNLDAEYFVFWMNYAINQRKMYINSANRTTIPNLSGSRLKEFLIPLPPLAEQQKIAAVLSAVQEAKEKTEAVIAAEKALKKSMMKHLFTYGPVSPQETERVRLKETEIGPVPKDWEVVKLGEIAENRKETVDPNKEDIIYVGLEHINSGDSKLTRYGNSREIKSSKSRFYKDDILYAKLRPYLDKGILAEFEGICSTDILVIKPNKELINPQFLTDLLHMPNFLDFATKSMTGVNHPRTSWSILKSSKSPSLPFLPSKKLLLSFPPSMLKSKLRKIKRRRWRNCSKVFYITL